MKCIFPTADSIETIHIILQDICDVSFFSIACYIFTVNAVNCSTYKFALIEIYQFISNLFNSLIFPKIELLCESLKNIRFS